MDKQILHSLVLLAVVSVIYAQTFTVTSQYEPKRMTRRRYGNVVRCYYRYTCVGRLRVCRNTCGYFIETYYVLGCKDGFTGARCNVPLCRSPPCQNGGICVGKDKCECPSGWRGASCTLKECSSATDCYPGICNSAVKCVCAAGFEGPNCQKMKEGPILQGLCQGQLQQSGSTLTMGNCTAEENLSRNATLVVYTNQRDFNQIKMTYALTYRKLENRPPYSVQGIVREFQVGLISSSIELRLRDTNGDPITIPNPDTTCPSTASSTNPFETIPCDLTIPFTRGIAHRQQLDMVIVGTTGGFKEIRRTDGSGRYDNKSFTGEVETWYVTFNFDLEPPYHCTERNTCLDPIDAYLPLVTLADFTRSPHVTLLFFGWNDEVSEISHFSYNVYKMVYVSQGFIQESESPAASGRFNRWDDVDEANFTLPESGMFSIIGQVVDFASNIRYARAFVLYTDENNKIEPTGRNWTVSRSVNLIGRSFWLQDHVASVTFNWNGAYSNKFIDENNLFVRISNVTDKYPNLIDYSPRGNISTDGTNNRGGITKFSYNTQESVQNDSGRKKRALTVPQTWIPLDTLSENQTITRPSINDFTFWIKAEDELGNVFTDHVFVRRDVTPPTVSADNAVFRKNIQWPGMRGYFSGIDLDVIDEEGGLFRIDHSLFDVTVPLQARLIGTSSQGPQTTDTDRTVCTLHNNCTCTRVAGECYKRPQMIFVDNCWFLEFQGAPIMLKATVFNRALLDTNVSVQLPAVSALSGIGEYPPPENFRLVRAFPYSVRVTWYLPVACYPIFTINIALEGGAGSKPSLSADSIETEITDLTPGTEYTANLFIVYENREQSEKVSLTFRTGPPPTQPPQGLGAGAIVGIVIGVLLLIGIVVIVVLILLRIRKKQPPLPRRLTVAQKNIRDRMSRAFGRDYGEPPPPYPNGLGDGMHVNLAYTSGPKLHDSDDDIYAYGGMETDPSAKWKHDNDRVVIGKSIHIGRFAEIREGTLRDGTGNKTVAVKMLKDHSVDNELLMKAKMNFMATAVPNHNNIVNFVGAITEGPILLLEYCDRPLKDWLKSISKVTDEVEDNMTNFCTDIARGMQHLHDNEIVHRRLGARNVLLKHIPMMGRYVAKVTGFGPMKGEQRGNDVDLEKERIPIKWMAIEQIGLVNKKKTRPYNEKTDVWSFGVTVWEIYSLGGSPYANKKHGEIKSLLDQGERLPCPEESSEDLYEQVMMPCWEKSPSKRPTFDEVKSTLERLFHGAPDGDEYYGDQEDYDYNAPPPLYDGTLPTKPQYI